MKAKGCKKKKKNPQKRNLEQAEQMENRVR